MTLAIQLVTLSIPLLAFYYVGRTMIEAWRQHRRQCVSNEEWEHIKQLAESGDPEQVHEAGRLYLDKIKRGPYG